MTIGQITARDDFAKRIAAEKPVYLHECLYPLMQGWDSVEIRADVELGGTEQLFSLLVARDLQKAQGQEPQVALTMPILVGTDGVRRMGKSLGNYIGVAEPAENQFGKIMSIPDEPMRQYFTLLTDMPLEEVDRCWRRASTRGTPRRCWARRSWRSTTAEAAAERGGGRVPPAGRRRDPDEIPEVATRRGQARRRRPDRRHSPDQGARPGIEHVERAPRDRAGGCDGRSESSTSRDRPEDR